MNDIVHPHNFNRLLHGTFFPLSQTTATEKKRQVHPRATISSTYHSNFGGNFDTNYYCICKNVKFFHPPPQKFKELSVVVKGKQRTFWKVRLVHMESSKLNYLLGKTCVEAATVLWYLAKQTSVDPLLQKGLKGFKKNTQSDSETRLRHKVMGGG